MDYDADKVDEMVLALLCLTMFPESGGPEHGKGTPGKHWTGSTPKATSPIRRARLNQYG